METDVLATLFVGTSITLLLAIFITMNVLNWFRDLPDHDRVQIYSLFGSVVHKVRTPKVQLPKKHYIILTDGDHIVLGTTQYTVFVHPDDVQLYCPETQQHTSLRFIRSGTHKGATPL